MLLVHTEIDAGEVLLGDEVDDTGHGVGAVGRRGAAGQDVDAVDQRKRDVVQVDAAARVGAGTRRVESSSTRLRFGPRPRRSTVRGTVVAVVDVLSKARDDARNGAQNLLGVGRLTKVDFLLANNRDRRGRSQVRVADQGTGDDDLAALALRRRNRFLRLRARPRVRVVPACV